LLPRELARALVNGRKAHRSEAIQLVQKSESAATGAALSGNAKGVEGELPRRPSSASVAGSYATICAAWWSVAKAMGANTAQAAISAYSLVIGVSFDFG
jgi:hypothetical protein